MASRHVFSFAAILFVLSLFLPPPAAAATRRNVLVLHNFNQDHPAIAAYDQGLQEMLVSDARYDIRVSKEFLNLVFFEQSSAYLPDAAAYLVMKYSLWKPDVIVMDSSAVPFYRRYLADSFRDVPLLVPVDADSGNESLASPNTTEVVWGVTAADIEKNLQLILALRPATRTVYVVLGVSAPERSSAARIAPALAAYANRLDIVLTTDMTHAAMLDAVAGAASDAAVLFVRFARDVSGATFVPAAVLREVTRRAKVPVFGVDAHLLGDGMVGGYVDDVAQLGRFMGARILEALDGRLAGGGPPLRPDANAYVFDQRRLDHFGLDAAKLPAGSRLLFRTVSLWESHRGLVLGGTVLVAAEAFLILGLVVNRMRRKRAEAALLAVNATLERRVRERTSELHESNVALLTAKESLEVLSRTDALTALPNRRHAEEFAVACHGEFQRHGAAYALAVLDIDFFKKVNDLHGHEAGDMLLRRLGEEMVATARAGDMVARWGGEEFLFVLPHTDAASAGKMLERIRERIAATAYACRDARLRVTVTAGVAEATAGDDCAGGLRRADEALYRGKTEGRNRVVTA